MGLSVSRLDEELVAWKRSVGAGMIEFDRAWLDAQKRGEGTPADHVCEGAHALLDAFVARLKSRRSRNPESGAKRMPMSNAEVLSALQQAECEVDYWRRKLERQSRFYESFVDGDPRKEQLVLEVGRTLEKYHAADDDAQQWADALERLSAAS